MPMPQNSPGDTILASEWNQLADQIDTNTSKLAGIEAAADVTDATNVAAAGAHMAGGTDVPVADGGTGASDAATARTNLGVDAAGTDNSTDVTLAGETYLTLSGQEITAAKIGAAELDVTGASAGQQLTVNEGETALEYSLASKYLSVRKGSVGTITAGTPVYLDAYNPSGFSEVEIADQSNAALMPAIGVAFESITNGAGARVLMQGIFNGLDTSAYSVKDRLYVAAAVGAGLPWLTATKPTSGKVQAVATVVRSHPSLGAIVVHGASRSNDIPHFTAADKYWYGSTAGQSVEGDITAAGRAILDDADASAQRTTLGVAIGTDVQAYSSVLAATTASYTTAEASKLSGIEAAADVTDATNVGAAGAPIISSGAGAPASTPTKVGDIYIDTTGDNAYIAVGTASSADWEISNDGTVNPGGTVTVATGDLVLVQDVSDSNSLQRVTAQSIADLGGGGEFWSGYTPVPATGYGDSVNDRMTFSPNVGTTVNQALSSNYSYYWPTYCIHNAINVDAVILKINSYTSTTSGRFALYEDDAGAPGSLLVDFGITDISSGGEIVWSPSSLTMTRGMYWFYHVINLGETIDIKRPCTTQPDCSATGGVRGARVGTSGAVHTDTPPATAPALGSNYVTSSPAGQLITWRGSFA